MADIKRETDGPSPFAASGYDFTKIPDYDNDFIGEEDLVEFERALTAPEILSPSQDDLLSPGPTPHNRSIFITALNDWRPIHQRVRKKKRDPRRGKDETREGFVYVLLKWPLLLFVLGWLFVLGVSYLFTRLYIYLYEHWVTWRGRRNRLRKDLQKTKTYEEWVEAANELDKHLNNDKWKKVDEYAYYDSKTIRRVRDQLVKLRAKAEVEDTGLNFDSGKGIKAVDELRALVEACVKNNFAGYENPRLYSETYFGTKSLVQSFVDEAEKSLQLLLKTKQLDHESKRTLFKHLYTNFGRTALCLSGGATFAYYHFGVAKALLDANLMPEVITGTSGGALVAGLLATRTDEELKRLLVPALANRITACHDDMLTWFKRWCKTGARFDSVDWARRCAWFTRGSMTFREAYERTGRILNVSCVPSDPHSPTILANYLTSPDCVIWSAVLASAAVPGILNPVVLMKKTKDGTLTPYSFGHKWKDGSLRTDIPLKALNLHFNVNFSIVSQVNPHINLFFFSSRGSVGRPVTHRRGRGWRGGFLGSATEQYLKLDLTKWLKVLRHLELLPRPLGQDWSEIWLQRFSGTITIWPKSVVSDFWHILSDPNPERLGRMIHVGQQSAFPKLKFIANRMKLERLIEEGRRATRPKYEDGSLNNVLSEDDLRALLKNAKQNSAGTAPPPFSRASSRGSTSGRRSPAIGKPPPLRTQISGDKKTDEGRSGTATGAESPSLGTRFSGWWKGITQPERAQLRRRSHRSGYSSPYEGGRPQSMIELRPSKSDALDYWDRQRSEDAQEEDHAQLSRRGSIIKELERQSQVFYDDENFDVSSGGGSESEEDEEGEEGDWDGVERQEDGEEDFGQR
ncbi:patatin-domain-containing protein [Patellaria atrata CBS 101060]|uniref:Patatin-like phospholipase domain-containing protein n=1 Tax=Patellaria atrata CBS 101060 TaxID=1346257 RepID=A0A9P4S865_9PEZI|nr:patatin-domain-containing protein [Patellaria atrata CBS 101060]